MANAQLETKSIFLEQGALAAKVSPKGFQDISLLTGGMEAGGHGLYIDEGTVETCMTALMGRSIPCYLTHEGMQADRLGKEIGVVSGIYRDGLKVRASQLNFLDSFGRHETSTRDNLVELATSYPDQLGVSLVASYQKVWVTPSGDEVAFSEPKPEQVLRDVPSMRVKAIRSADLVQRPAANIGLFSEKIDDATDGMATATTSDTTHIAALAAKDAELVSLKTAKDTEIVALGDTHKAEIAALTTKHEAALSKKDTDHVAALAAKVEELTKTHTAALAAKDVELAAAKVFDARQLGLSEAILTAGKLGNTAGTVAVPAAGKNDSENWEIFSALEGKDPKAALAFKEKHLSGLEKKMVTFTPAG